ncbi:hypothetical protein ACKEPL_01035 [Acinetobacter baumannii]|uniref:hypothetical protein n=1 Tax=Acinetobacter baumannii TaxID=470 RepID=UPI0002B9463C|nr:hypothetical protein [Acinetobacter baumannii]EXD17326.1 hypothetical protein J479_1310 [Acinetobacter baumannii 1297]MDC4500946.1 hypothetical protein [Acinetobacter baumannii]MDC4734715.1 hypothetical protein [Acinetobacter baumannii]MDC5148800.1 hypothetical protein [Acinetobacter baumannii]MDC5458798.1 hypothetical protein [Acinetobacter baumannii]
MSQSDLIRFPARLDPKIHSDLLAYVKQQGGSINTAINNLLQFALKYALQGEGNLLDCYLPDSKTNLSKAEFIIEQFIHNEISSEFDDPTKGLKYQEYISTKIEELEPHDKKLLAELAGSLARKKAP